MSTSQFYVDDKLQPLVHHIVASNEGQYASAGALVVIQSGKIRANWRYGTGTGADGTGPVTTDSRFNGYSLRKIYIGLAAAIAMYDGKRLDVDTLVRPLALQLPHDPEFQTDDISPDLRIRHLLTHTHGLNLKDGKVVQVFDPGARWMYNNIGVELLCRLVFADSGKTIAEIIRERVSIPAGFVGTAWEDSAKDLLVRDVHGKDHPRQLQLGPVNGYDRNLYVQPDELARFAWMHLRGGKLDANQLVPQEVIEMVTQCYTPESVSANWPSHGFFWWLRTPYAGGTEIGEGVPPRAFQAGAMNGSLCLVIPELDAVVVRMMNKIGAPPTFNRFAEYHEIGNLATKLLS